MHPSCSQFAKQALGNYGLLNASLITTDRLLRCGHDLQNNYKFIDIDGYTLAYDPINSLMNPLSEPVDIDYFLPLTWPNNFGFADSLLMNEDYLIARLEFERLLQKTHRQNDKNLLLARIGVCFYYLDDLEGLIGVSKRLLVTDAKSEAPLDYINYLIARSYFKEKKYQVSLGLLYSLQNDTTVANEVQFLKGLNQAYLHHWVKSREMMFFVTDSYLEQYAVRFLTIDKEVAELPLQNPNIAGLFSAIIPGSGYFLSNQKSTAFTAFFINALFSYTAVEALRKKNYGISAISITFGMGWYVGAIRGSITSLKKKNLKLKNDLIKDKFNHL